MRAVDTNVLVRLVVPDDAVQVAAAGRFVAGGVWASHVVLAEFAWALEFVYGFAPARIADAVDMLLRVPTLVIDDTDVVASALHAFRAKPAVGFPDHLILEIARKAGHLPLGTFDRRLGKVAGAEAL